MANTHVATTEQPNVHPHDLDDLYAVLNISKSATADEIKMAYRQQAMKYHPDRTAGDEEMSDIFRAVQRAYDILMDPEKRKYYDETGKVKLDDAMLRAEALSVLNHNVIQAIDAIAQSQDPTLEVWRANPLTAVKAKLSQDLANGRTNLKAMQKATKRYEALIERLRSRKNPKFNESPIGVLLAQRLDNLDDSIEKVGNMIQIHEYAIKMVDDYDYDMHTPPEAFTSDTQQMQQMQQFMGNPWYTLQQPPR